ncbi:hypothetical protein GUJ93_ZPchr0001g31095 [Zizania palustris]|uniref:Uncharacterized protein n=1 Tax=Zizania palustris TaxID=103762 RepID=A0A8J5RNE6_ZIZPA|nr:hypothetical protein GUJ93_ZPchr0001g31095 [Zizania palustris]
MARALSTLLARDPSRACDGEVDWYGQPRQKPPPLERHVDKCTCLPAMMHLTLSRDERYTGGITDAPD